MEWTCRCRGVSTTSACACSAGRTGGDMRVDDSKDRFLKVKEICRFLGISKSTFYKLVNEQESGLADVVVRLPGVDGWRARLGRLKEWAESGM